METNKKLKGMYFVWGDKYYEPFPRSFNDTFEHYLFFAYYNFNNDWLEKIISECKLKDKKEFEEQITLIDQDYQRYREQQNIKLAKRDQKKRNIYFARCVSLGILPF